VCVCARVREATGGGEAEGLQERVQQKDEDETRGGVAARTVNAVGQGLGHGLDVHEVAESSARALALLILATARLAEIRHGRELGHDGTLAKPAVVQVLDCFLSVQLVFEHDVSVCERECVPCV